MRITVPITTGMGVGQTTEVESRDSYVEVPSIVAPIAEVLFPTHPNSVSTEISAESVLCDNFRSANNQPLGVDLFVTLAKGLWTLDMWYSWSFDYTAPLNFTKFVSLNLTYLGFNPNLLGMSPRTGTFQGASTIKVLLRDTGQLNFNYPATAVGEHLECYTRVTCTRHL